MRVPFPVPWSGVVEHDDGKGDCNQYKGCNRDRAAFVLAVLRLAENLRDQVAGLRVLQLMPGIGPSTAGQIPEAMDRSLNSALGATAFRIPAR